MNRSSKTGGTRPATAKRHTVNLTKDVTDLVDAEAEIEVPAEPLDRSLMTRILIREAINARRKTRGEPQLEENLRTV